MVSENSPAEKAGLKQGDVIIQVGNCKVENLQDYTNCLSNYKPQDTTEFKFVRDGEEKVTKITFEAR